ncbi:hypothetical protein Taro_044477 [Colocasia esculenta]|uniref:Uncharacterized protein n=1 Tax=Colocasia esculenta TaxID=4460 RepID=A0A843WJA5_COLES|nr:hypothetical protein [Colocasia esculenta]
MAGATIVDLSVVITPAPDYQLPPAALTPPVPQDTKPAGGAESAVQKAEDVVTSMLAKGFVLGKDVLGKAKSFDERHQLTSTATAKVVSLDRKIGLSEKVSMGTSAVNEKVKEMDQKFQVSEKTKSAFAAAEQKVSSAGSAILKNRYVFQGTAWVTGAFNKVAKAAGEVGSKTKEKVDAEQSHPKGLEDDFAQGLKNTWKPGSGNVVSNGRRQGGLTDLVDHDDPQFSVEVTAVSCSSSSSSFFRFKQGKETNRWDFYEFLSDPQERQRHGEREREMVLWEITLATAYFLGLKRTYKLALKLQRRVVTPRHPKLRRFLHR